MPEAQAKPNPTHALLWSQSQSQSALHIEPIDDMLAENRRAYTDDKRMDYVPIVFGSGDECHQIARSVRKTIADRQAARQVDFIAYHH